MKPFYYEVTRVYREVNNIIDWISTDMANHIKSIYFMNYCIEW